MGKKSQYTKEEDIRRDVHVIAPNLFSGAATGDE